MSTDSGGRLPVFIHSLFRSGSTYIFKVFRRSAEGYWCYQEPLHEAVLDANEDPRRLLSGRGDVLVRELRHPPLEADYFQELFDVWPAWKDTLSTKAIYEGYFSTSREDVGLPFLRTLEQSARGRPVFQECRTSGRIASLKRLIGGTHIYLWRNPWDQWWSYKVARYFDAANLLIVNAPDAPRPVELMRTALRINHRLSGSVSEQFSSFWNIFLTAEESYQVFYTLWCLGAREGLKNADVLLSIDGLSDSKVYQSEVVSRLSAAGIDGIDFSDCHVPQGRYVDADVAFFAPLEQQVHEWLMDGGWSQADIDEVQAMRQRYQPAARGLANAGVNGADLDEQAGRARGLARRFETALAERSRTDAGLIAEGLARAQRAESAEAAVQAQLNDERANLRQVLQAAEQTERREVELRAQLQQALEVARAAQIHVQQTEARAQRFETGMAETKAQLQLALELGRQSQLLAQRAEAKAQQLEHREADLRAQAQKAQQLASQLESSLVATRQELELVKQANHHNWHLAEERRRYIDTLYNSTSWRITAPLRGLRRALGWPLKWAVTFRTLLAQVFSVFRRVLVHTVKASATYAKRSPRFRRIALGLLHRMPSVLVKLRQIHIESQSAHVMAHLDTSVGSALTHTLTSDDSSTRHHLDGREVLAVDGINSAQRTPLEAQFHAYVGRK